MEDSRIIDLFWAREQAALEQTQNKYGSYLTRVANQILGDREDSEESVNDAYMAAWDAIPPHRPESLCAFLSKITRRIAIDRLRKRESQKRGGDQYVLSISELSECLPGEADTEKTVEARALAEAVRAFVAGLPEKQRQVFLGRYYFADSIRQIARYTNTTEANAKVMLHRTRAALRTYLEQEGLV